jgi:hypothetical protein
MQSVVVALVGVAAALHYRGHSAADHRAMEVTFVIRSVMELQIPAAVGAVEESVVLVSLLLNMSLHVIREQLLRQAITFLEEREHLLLLAQMQ